MLYHFLTLRRIRFLVYSFHFFIEIIQSFDLINSEVLTAALRKLQISKQT
jgi:hypothetical protein